jgi:hypothetical protein
MEPAPRIRIPSRFKHVPTTRIRLNFRIRNSLPAAKITANFGLFAPFDQLWQRFIQQSQRVAHEFPTRRNSELFFREQRTGFAEHRKAGYFELSRPPWRMWH